MATGNKAPWQKYYADDCIFHDEKGRNLDKTKLIADLEPLPKGYAGTIKVTKPESRITTDAAVLSYDTEETETVFGQELHARYHGGSFAMASGELSPPRPCAITKIPRSGKWRHRNYRALPALTRSGRREKRW
ncbi:MAG: nuclear transport factor 2 family protein [Verrucomicrobiota bacterium]|nr:nuclear transport factor 2 family protein [Verrucomicrobiota bacterium]